MEFNFKHKFIPELPEEPIVEEEPNNLFNMTVYEPMRQNRWIVTLPTEIDIHSWALYETSRPSIDMSGGYEPILLKFRDPIGPSTTQKLWDLYAGITDNLETINVNDISDELRERFSEIRSEGLTYTLEMLDPTGAAISRWTIHDCEILNFDFGNLNYDSDDLAYCSLLVKPTTVTLHY